jgi:histidine ammonia-lyase
MNARTVVAIELLSAAQSIDFHRPLQSSHALEAQMGRIRSVVPFYDHERHMAPDIAAAEALIDDPALGEAVQHLLPSSV